MWLTLNTNPISSSITFPQIWKWESGRNTGTCLPSHPGHKTKHFPGSCSEVRQGSGAGLCQAAWLLRPPDWSWTSLCTHLLARCWEHSKGLWDPSSDAATRVKECGSSNNYFLSTVIGHLCWSQMQVSHQPLWEVLGSFHQLNYLPDWSSCSRTNVTCWV